MKSLFLFFALSLALNCHASSEGKFESLPGKWLHEQYESAQGNRDYYFYVPSRRPSAPMPVILMLHGCTQDPSGFAKDTGMNELAESMGFIALYPEQSNKFNVLKCWNWFKPENHERGSGELALVVGMTQQLMARYNIDSKKIYAAGFSAGAAMATNLAACYSDFFAGVAIHSGLEFRAASTEADAKQAMRSGSKNDLAKMAKIAASCAGAKRKLIEIVSIHGSADSVVNSINGDRIVQQSIQINDWLDDDKNNNSQKPTPIESKDLQVPNGRKYSVQTFGDSIAHVQRIMVDGMGHAWSGSAQQAQYTDPKGPKVSEMIWQFFLP